MNILTNLTRIKASEPKGKRVGRGIGSGKGGHNSGKGSKGQNARTGHKVPLWFEGGQTPMTKRMPYMKGFTNHNKTMVFSFNLGEIEVLFENHNLINPDLFFQEGMLNFDPSINIAEIKLLGKGEITKAINFEGFKYSKLAKDK